ncbi:hypothetical protein [Oryza sativa Japonica Group]|uniref:Uncharacterized protein n=1 Tax=Oryza sativa subsp. japonica TaxID=39947 RepID=Q5VP00_ORYSJ|nr:hypothetical protein [Oryza sativa Japonica Group]
MTRRSSARARWSKGLATMRCSSVVAVTSSAQDWAPVVGAGGEANAVAEHDSLSQLHPLRHLLPPFPFFSFAGCRGRQDPAPVVGADGEADAAAEHDSLPQLPATAAAAVAATPALPSNSTGDVMSDSSDLVAAVAAPFQFHLPPPGAKLATIAGFTSPPRASSASLAEVGRGDQRWCGQEEKPTSCRPCTSSPQAAIDKTAHEPPSTSPLHTAVHEPENRRRFVAYYCTCRSWRRNGGTDGNVPSHAQTEILTGVVRFKFCKISVTCTQYHE